MSLTAKQEEDTRRELAENLDKSGLKVSEVASALGTTEKYIEQLLALEPRRLEDTWILRNHLIEAVRAKGTVPTKFTALVGDWHGYWFLDGDYIDGGQIR